MPHPRDIATEADASPRATRVVAYWEGGFGTFTLPPTGKVTVGRLPECGVCIDHPSVSRQHAEIHVGPPLRVVDLGSFNGTRVGGVRVAPNEPVTVPPRAVIEVGSTLLVVETPADVEAAPSSRVPRSIPSEGNLVIVDERMRQLHRLLRSVAQGTLGIVLLGETGVGKEVIARAIHRYSPRAGGPFLSINCAAIPEQLLESELFGHERGAFTGAVKDKLGLLEAASGGTLLLDEVGEMALPAQAKLLRAIESHEIVRVGGVRPRPADVRFVSATNRDLEALIEARQFRRDLFFRLGGIAVTVPPLRERTGELDELARRFLAESARGLGRGPQELTGEALAALKRHRWPGNVRELRNVLERAVLLSDGGPIRPEHVTLGTSMLPPPPGMLDDADLEEIEPDPDDGPPSAAGSTLTDELRALERQKILDALEQCAGNQTRAAQRLGITRRALIHRLEVYGVARPRKR